LIGYDEWEARNFQAISVSSIFLTSPFPLHLAVHRSWEGEVPDWKEGTVRNIDDTEIAWRSPP
jgi:hypothetical protein